MNWKHDRETWRTDEWERDCDTWRSGNFAIIMLITPPRPAYALTTLSRNRNNNKRLGHYDTLEEAMEAAGKIAASGSAS